MKFQLIHSFIYLVFRLTTGPKPLPKRAVHIMRSRASSFKWEYPLLSLRSSSSFLRLLPRLPVTSISPFIFPSITRCRRQFLRKMWPIQLDFRLLISCRIFLCSLTLSNTRHVFKVRSSLKLPPIGCTVRERACAGSYVCSLANVCHFVTGRSLFYVKRDWITICAAINNPASCEVRAVIRFLLARNNNAA